MEIVLIVMLWEMSLILAFMLGRRSRSKKKVAARPEPSEKELMEAKKAQRELENFMSYNGTEQEAIND